MANTTQVYIEYLGTGAWTVCQARYQTPEESAKYIEELRATAMLGIAGTTVCSSDRTPDAARSIIADVTAGKSIGWVPGGNTAVWPITDEQAAALAATIKPMPEPTMTTKPGPRIQITCVEGRGWCKVQGNTVTSQVIYPVGAVPADADPIYAGMIDDAFGVYSVLS
jgi:hypothetical protein